MLRSMIIGLAIAALLQVGTRTVTPPNGVALAKQIDWVQVQSNALAHLIYGGCTSFTR